MHALTLVLLVSCAAFRPAPQPAPWCVSTCGLKLLPFEEAFRPTCEAFQGVEDAALATFTRAAAIDARFATACKRLSFFTVQIGPSVLVHPFTGAGVNGVTMCERGRVYVGHRAELAQSALQHELAHVAQSCEPLPPIEPEDPDHSNWAALYAVGVQ